jgi:hypothetical protein
MRIEGSLPMLASTFHHILPFQGLISEFGVLIEFSGSCSMFLLAPVFISTFFTSERLTSYPNYLCQKDERALPGGLRSRKFSSVSP